MSYFDKAIRFASSHKNVEVHLNSNLVSSRINMDTLQQVRRLKVSLDTCEASEFDMMVRKSGAYTKVLANLDKVAKLSVNTRPFTSITYTVTKQNMHKMAAFAKMCKERLPFLYAVFFSCYKGNNPDLYFTAKDIKLLTKEILPAVRAQLKINEDTESLWLLNNSHDSKTFVQGIRFRDNKNMPCYLQLSELTVDEKGHCYLCSHLYRDGVGKMSHSTIDSSLEDIMSEKGEYINVLPVSYKCLYGCNKKLVHFNKNVHKQLSKE